MAGGARGAGVKPWPGSGGRDRRLHQREVDLELSALARHALHRDVAAVLADDGRMFVGCNVENASYGLTICAERAAVCAAVAAGVRSLRAVAVMTDLEHPASPCGACRQVLAEFGIGMAVVLAGRNRVVRLTSLRELLPAPFTFGDFAP